MSLKSPIVIGTVLVVVLSAGIFFARTVFNPGVKVLPSLESVSTGEAPWAPELAHLRERLKAIGLPALSSEGTALHIHQHLSIFIHGVSTTVPKDIGVQEGPGGFISPLHIHDTSGVVHVESPTVETFTLGQFFNVWGVRLTDSCIGGYCSDATNTLKLYINGTPYTGDPQKLELAPHQVLVITFGMASETPAIIPTSYSFPAGY